MKKRKGCEDPPRSVNIVAEWEKMQRLYAPTEKKRLAGHWLWRKKDTPYSRTTASGMQYRSKKGDDRMKIKVGLTEEMKKAWEKEREETGITYDEQEARELRKLDEAFGYDSDPVEDTPCKPV